MSAQRLFALLRLLINQPGLTAPQLARRLEVSVRTVYRDVEALSQAGVPVYAQPGRGGGVRLMEGYVLDRDMFTPAQREQLLAAVNLMPGADSALAQKLRALFQGANSGWLQVDFSRWGATQDDRKFDLLRQAILDRRRIAFTYHAASGQTQSRRACPARLVFKAQAWYLQGFCLDRHAYRTFKLTRMAKLRALDEGFDPLPQPPAIEVQAVAGQAVHLRFAPDLAYRVYDEFDPDAVARGEDGCLDVSANMPVDNWLCGYLISFGGGVEVVQPAVLRQHLARYARDIYKAYQNHDIGCQGLPGIMGPSNRRRNEPMSQQFCQSCGMPLTQAVLGTQADGTPSQDYCSYCYQGGQFTGDMTMDQMIDFCVPHMVEGNPGMTAQQAKDMMREFFPTLKRWQ